MHTAAGDQDYVAGQAFYRGHGHAAEIIDGAESVDFWPTTEFDVVIRNISGR